MCIRDRYTYNGPFDLSDEGKLIGHVVIGERMVAQAIEGIADFPQSLALKLRHMILSHHGKLEWGSPKRPKTLEAIALHLADYFDACVAQFTEVVEESSNLEMCIRDRPAPGPGEKGGESQSSADAGGGHDPGSGEEG